MNLISRSRRAFWTYRQPLTKHPKRKNAPISDLFLWRRGLEWKTFFDLTDIGALFLETEDIGKSDTFVSGSFEQYPSQNPTTDPESTVKIMLFNQSGQKFTEHDFLLLPFKRQQVAISDLAKDCEDDIGTFCVLHTETPRVIRQLGSNLAERGYVSYCYKNSPVRAYVHGNLDAVSTEESGQIERLGGSSILPRQYLLQHLLKETGFYELAVVNTTETRQEIVCDILVASTTSLKIEQNISQIQDGLTTQTPLYAENSIQHVDLKAGACHLFRVEAAGLPLRAVFKSHLVMARPVVFYVNNNQMDVFHG